MNFKVIGAGLAGVEAAWQIAQSGNKVTLYEQKPNKNHPRINRIILPSLFAPIPLKPRVLIPRQVF